MHAVLKEALFANWQLIVSNLPFDLVIHKFIWAFSPDEYESIILESGENNRRSEQLLLVLSQKGDALFYELMKYLQMQSGGHDCVGYNSTNSVAHVDTSKAAVGIVQKIVSSIETAYDIQALSNVKWHGLCWPNVHIVTALTNSGATIQFDQLYQSSSPFTLFFDPSVTTTATSVDEITQLCEGFAWSFMKQNNKNTDTQQFCITFHQSAPIAAKSQTEYQFLTCLLFDLHTWICRKCKNFLKLSSGPSPLSPLMLPQNFSQISLLSWLKTITTDYNIRILVVLGCHVNGNTEKELSMKIFYALQYAGISTVAYSLDLAHGMGYLLEKNGLKVVRLNLGDYIQHNLATTSKHTSSGDVNNDFGKNILLNNILLGNDAATVFSSLTENVQNFVKICAIIRNRSLPIKVMKCIWKFLSERFHSFFSTSPVIEFNVLLDLLIEKKILMHFLGSYFLSPSMRSCFIMLLGGDNSKTTVNETKQWHQNLLQSYLERYKTWLGVPQRDTYFHMNAVHHFVQSGWILEAVNLFSNLEWIFQRIDFGFCHQLVFDLKYIISNQEQSLSAAATPSDNQEVSPLYQLLRVFQLSFNYVCHSPASSSSSQLHHYHSSRKLMGSKRMLIAFMLSTLCHKINSSPIFSKLFAAIPSILNNSEDVSADQRHSFWFLPLHSSLLPKIDLNSRTVSGLPTDTKCIFCDQTHLLLFLANTTDVAFNIVLLVAKVDHSLESVVRIPSQSSPKVVTRGADNQFNFLTHTSQLWSVNFDARTSHWQRSLHQEVELRSFCLIASKCVLITFHDDSMLNIWCSYSLELFSSLSLSDVFVPGLHNDADNSNSNDDGASANDFDMNVSSLSDSNDNFKISWAFADGDDIVRCAIIDCQQSCLCVVMEFDFESMELSRITSFAVSTDVVFASISCSSQFIVCFTNGLSATEVYSIGNDTLIKSKPNLEMEQPFQALRCSYLRTTSGFYILVFENGQIEVCNLEGEAQVSSVWSQKLTHSLSSWQFSPASSSEIIVTSASLGCDDDSVVLFTACASHCLRRSSFCTVIQLSSIFGHSFSVSTTTVNSNSDHKNNTYTNGSTHPSPTSSNNAIPLSQRNQSEHRHQSPVRSFSLFPSSSTQQRLVINDAHLNSDGSLIYVLTQKRLVCQATDTLNPVQLYSLPTPVLMTCYSGREFGGEIGCSLMFLYLQHGAFKLLKCPSFETWFDSSSSLSSSAKVYTKKPAFVFFHQELLFLVFEGCIEVWNCLLKKHVLINIQVELPIEDAVVVEQNTKLQLLQIDGSIKVINLIDMTWDVIECAAVAPHVRSPSSCSSSSPSYFSYRKPLLSFSSFYNQYFIATAAQNFTAHGSSILLLAEVFNSSATYEVDVGLDLNIYEMFFFRVLPNGSIVILLNNDTKNQIIMKSIGWMQSSSEFQVLSSLTISDDNEELCERCRQNIQSIDISPDGLIVCWFVANKLFVFPTPGFASPMAQGEKRRIDELSCNTYKCICYEVNYVICKSAFVSNWTLFISCEDASVFLFNCHTKLFTPSFDIVYDGGKVTKIDTYLWKDSASIIVTCDTNSMIAFWTFSTHCDELKLIHSQETSSEINADTLSYFGQVNSVWYYICVSLDATALVWTIDGDGSTDGDGAAVVDRDGSYARVLLCDQCDIPPSTWAVLLNNKTHCLLFMRHDYAISCFDINADKWDFKVVVPKHLAVFNNKHRFLGTSGLIASVTHSGVVIIWDSISQGVCATLLCGESKVCKKRCRKEDLTATKTGGMGERRLCSSGGASCCCCCCSCCCNTTESRSGGGDSNGCLVDVKVVTESSFLLLAFSKSIEVMCYDEESLLLDVSNGLIGCSEGDEDETREEGSESNTKNGDDDDNGVGNSSLSTLASPAAQSELDSERESLQPLAITTEKVASLRKASSLASLSTLPPPSSVLNLCIELNKLVVCPENHSLFAVIDSRGFHHMIELYNKQLFNLNPERQHRSFYFTKLFNKL